MFYRILTNKNILIVDSHLIKSKIPGKYWKVYLAITTKKKQLTLYNLGVNSQIYAFPELCLAWLITIYYVI